MTRDKIFHGTSTFSIRRDLIRWMREQGLEKKHLLGRYWGIGDIFLGMGLMLFVKYQKPRGWLLRLLLGSN